MIQRRPALVALISFAFAALSCNQLRPQYSRENDVDLQLTIGGFRSGHPYEGELNGVCTPDAARTSVDCDVYNGMAGWSIREITIVVTWSPYAQNDKRYYSERVFIDPQKTERVTIRLGLQLPLDIQLRNKRGIAIGPPSQHWGWNLVGAKGHRLVAPPA